MKLVGSLTNKNIRDRHCQFYSGKFKTDATKSNIDVWVFFMAINQEKWPEDSPAKHVYSVFIYNEMNAHD